MAEILSMVYLHRFSGASLFFRCRTGIHSLRKKQNSLTEVLLQINIGRWCNWGSSHDYVIIVVVVVVAVVVDVVVVYGGFRAHGC